jgi:hypothetical protein
MVTMRGEGLWRYAPAQLGAASQGYGCWRKRRASQNNGTGGWTRPAVQCGLTGCGWWGALGDGRWCGIDTVWWWEWQESASLELTLGDFGSK